MGVSWCAVCHEETEYVLTACSSTQNECERKQPRFLDFGAHMGDAGTGRKGTRRN